MVCTPGGWSLDPASQQRPAETTGSAASLAGAQQAPQHRCPGIAESTIPDGPVTARQCGTWAAESGRWSIGMATRACSGLVRGPPPRESLKRGGSPQHSGPDSTPKAFHTPTPAPTAFPTASNRPPPPYRCHIPCDRSATALELPRSPLSPSSKALSPRPLFFSNFDVFNQSPLAATDANVGPWRSAPCGTPFVT